MRPTRSLEFCRLDDALHFDVLEERTTPAGFDPWMHSSMSEVISADGANGPYANAAPISAASLAQVRQAFPNTTGAGYSIAVLDTGVDYKHPALGGGFGAGRKVVAGYNFVDNSMPGFVSSIPMGGNPMDESGHGTHVAGIAAAKDPTYGGVAPDANIVALRVLDKNGHGSWSWIENALQWVINNRTTYNIASVNMSFGGGNYSGLTSDFNSIQTKLQTLWNAGVVNVASSGNDFYSNNSSQGIQFPAVSQWAVSVGAVYDGNYGQRNWSSGAVDYVTYSDKIASFTQRSDDLDLLAPGALITSTGLSNGGSANYVTYAGTSQASPFIAGAAVLVKQALVQSGQGASATAANIVDILRTTGVMLTDNKPLSQDNVGRTGLTFPRLNLLAALTKASGSVPHDAYEQNNSQSAAAFLGYLGASTTFSGLTFSTTTDQDWYSFIATSPGIYKIQTPVSAGMSVPALTFYDITVGKPRTINATVVNGIATINVDLRDKVRYFIRSQAYNGQRGGYQLSIASTSATGTPAPSPPLGPDRFETNQTQSAAKFIGYMGNTTVNSVSIHQDSDLDWYRFQSTVQTTQQIRVIADGNPGKVTFTFYDISANNPRTIAATFVNGVATLSVPLRTGVNYFLKVNGVSGATANYRVVFGTGSSSSASAASATVRSAESLDPKAVDKILAGL
jgi:subtilisin family serine protease